MDLLPRIEATWRLGRKQMLVPTLGYTDRVNAFITLFWPRKKIIWNLFERRRNIEFRKHLSNVVAAARRHRIKRVILFIDHASYHDTDEVKKFFREHKGILTVKFLGKKDPNSNPVELLVNKRMNSYVCVNKCHQDIAALKKTVRFYLKKYNLIYAT